MSELIDTRKKKKNPDENNPDMTEEEAVEKEENEGVSDMFSKWINEKVKGGKKKMVEVD
jgi:hypothetical protein